MPKHKTATAARMKGEGWVTIENPGLTVEAAKAKLIDLGNQVLEVDEEGRRIKIMHVDEVVPAHLAQVIDVWACDKCGAYSTDKRKAEAHESQCEVL